MDWRCVSGVYDVESWRLGVVLRLQHRDYGRWRWAVMKCGVFGSKGVLR